MQNSLFDSAQSSNDHRPFATRMRPSTLDGFFGQQDVIRILGNFSSENFPHLVFYGPSGSGKTTLAQIICKERGFEFYSFNAVMNGLADLRKLIAKVIEDRKMFNSTNVIFIDEIHRFNKAQQDALLPHLENGDFILFGATTEYPQTSLNRAVLSRLRIFELAQLSKENINQILVRAKQEFSIEIPTPFIEMISDLSNGDARTALSLLDYSHTLLKQDSTVSVDTLREELIKHSRLYDKNQDRHYDVISAFIKSIRGSDVDSALLWLAVMLDGNEDPAFIARRLIILASEDIGNADPQALGVVTNAHYAITQIGMPEARIILSQATTYLAQAPKSNASYLAIDAALAYVRDHETLSVPTHLRNHHPDKKNYIYPHNYPSHYQENAIIMKISIFIQVQGWGLRRFRMTFSRISKRKDD